MPNDYHESGYIQVNGNGSPLFYRVKIQSKLYVYIKIQKLGLELEKTRGSIVCRELLNLDVKHEPPVSSERTANFYDVRPCMKIIGDAAEILENFLKNNGLIKQKRLSLQYMNFIKLRYKNR